MLAAYPVITQGEMHMSVKNNAPVQKPTVALAYHGGVFPFLVKIVPSEAPTTGMIRQGANVAITQSFAPCFVLQHPHVSETHFALASGIFPLIGIEAYACISSDMTTCHR